MPFIKPRTYRVKSVRHICRLQEPNRDALVLYARLIGDTPDYVLNALIDATLAKDRDFLAWRAESPAVPALPLPSAVPVSPRPIRAAEQGREDCVRTLIEHRVVVSLACSSLVGTAGLQVWPFPAQDALLGLIAIQRPHLYGQMAQPDSGRYTLTIAAQTHRQSTR